MLKFKIVILFLFLLFPLTTEASVLYLDPVEGVIGRGDDIAVEIKIDVFDQCINTIDAEIIFPSGYLNLVDFLTGDSILSLWVDKPSKKEIDKTNEAGIIHFSGGIPGGYCGTIPGDPGRSNIIGRLIFHSPSFVVSDVKRDEVEIQFSRNTKAFLNDGFGTEDKLITKGATFKLVGKLQEQNDEWKKSIKEDNIPPEPFMIELHKGNSLFSGNAYIIFSTTDKQTGVDHFEVLEIKQEELSGINSKKNWFTNLFEKQKLSPQWQIAKMPYLLKDQKLQSIIKVKAIDKAGNERVIEYTHIDLNKKENKQTYYIEIIIMLLLLIIVIVSIFLFVKKRKNKIINE